MSMFLPYPRTWWQRVLCWLRIRKSHEGGTYMLIHPTLAHDLVHDESTPEED